ncbi:MAG: hypothetical protein Q4P66_08855 [Actinomycetaceae bacterium]|nr:hypothetical protein [Actinomycetaceae bacterium]
MALDPNLTAEQLQTLAAQNPDLHADIVKHPNCYPDLETWINAQGTVDLRAAHTTNPKPIETAANGQSAPAQLSPDAHSQSLPTAEAQVVTHTHTAGNPQTVATAPDAMLSSPIIAEASPATPPNSADKTPAKKSKKAARKRQIHVLITIVAVLAAFMALGSGYMVGLYYFKDKPGTPAKNAAPTSYINGVITANEHTAPDDAVVLASKSSADVVYSLVISHKEGEAAAHIMETKHGSNKSAIKAKLAKPLKDVLADPYATLCGEVDGLKCSPAAKKAAPQGKQDSTSDGGNDTGGAMIELEKVGTLTWSPDSAQWSADDVTFDANLIFGEVDNLVIGTQKCGDYAGQAVTASIPVKSITAFEADTGKPAWLKQLDTPGFVSISNNIITITDALVSDEEDLSANNFNGLSDEEAIDVAKKILEGANAAKVYELAPAEKGKGQTSKPEATKEAPVKKDAIRDFDFGNTEWNTAEMPIPRPSTTVLLTNGQYIPSDIPVTNPALDDLFKDNPEFDMTYPYDDQKPSIQYADMNGDGYEDALVPIIWVVPGGGNMFADMRVAWLWDPSTNSPQQVNKPVTSTTKDYEQWKTVTLEPDGSVTAVGIKDRFDNITIEWHLVYDSSSNSFVQR